MEDPELRKMIEETHRMVSQMYKYQKRQIFFRLLKTILIIVIIVGAYFAVLPFFNNALDTYNNFSSGVSNFESSFGSMFSGNGDATTE
jgi:polyferredoxin